MQKQNKYEKSEQGHLAVRGVLPPPASRVPRVAPRIPPCLAACCSGFLAFIRELALILAALTAMLAVLASLAL